MARVVVLGADIADHTTAQHLRRMLSKQHEIVIISPNSQWNWVPSDIWVGMGRIDKSKVLSPLHPIYGKKGIISHQAKAFEIYPEDRGEDETPVVKIEYTSPSKASTTDSIAYDCLINATGPKLNFDTTPDLGPDNDGNSLSVCTADHADEIQKELRRIVEITKTGKPQRLVIGAGHGACIYQSAAFEYALSVELGLREVGVRNLCEVVYITDEYELDGFDVGGVRFKQNGFMATSQLWTESLSRERSVKVASGIIAKRVNKGSLVYETFDGSEHELDFDFAVLLPPFPGHPFKAFAKDGPDITSTIFAPSGPVKVDADYSGKAYEGWDAEDWPKTYQNPTYDNFFVAGISFALPHQVPKPRPTPNSTSAAPAPPRMDQPSGTIGCTVAETIIGRIKGKNKPAERASMTKMGTSYVAPTDASLINGFAAAVVMYPIVPDEKKYPLTGRHPYHTRGGISLFSYWIKFIFRYLFIHKARGRIGWALIPE